MNELEMLALGNGREERSLQELHPWLRYEGLTGFLGGGAFFLPYGLVLTALIILAVAFTPYMLWKLARAGWYKSIAVFLVVVLGPLLASLFVEETISAAYYVLSIGPIVVFYVYTWVLHLVVGERLSALREAREYRYSRRTGTA